MLPELDPSVEVVPPRLELAERCAVPGHGQDGASGEVDAEADHLLGPHLAGRQRRRDPAVEDLEIVGGVLQRRVRRQFRVVRGKLRINDTVRVTDLDVRDFLPAAQIEEEHAA